MELSGIPPKQFQVEFFIKIKFDNLAFHQNNFKWSSSLRSNLIIWHSTKTISSGVFLNRLDMKDIYAPT
jgi:hypothetical protein